MRSLNGQAARVAGRCAHGMLVLVVMAAVLTAAVFAVFAWRLSQGPLDVPWLAHRLEAAAENDATPIRLSIGSAAIAWEGWRRGLDMPLDIRLADVRASDAAGVPIAEIPHGFVALSVRALLLGRLRPRSLELDDVRLQLARAADGAIGLDDGSPAPLKAAAPAASGVPAWQRLVAEFASPAGGDRADLRRSIVAQLRRLHVRNASIFVADRQLGTNWQLSKLTLELARSPRGGVSGQGDAEIAVADQRISFRMSAALAPGGTQTRLNASLGPVQPAALARAAPKLAPLAAMDAPVSLTASAELGPELAVQSAALDALAEAGRMRLGSSDLQLSGATLSMEARPDHVTVRKLGFGLRARDGGPLSQVQAHGEGQRTDQSLQANFTLELDQAAFADLPVLWPEGTGGGARAWIAANISSGTARNAHVEVQVAGPPDLSSITLTRSTGTVSGEDLTIWWLRPVPPIERAQAKLQILDPDTLEIIADSGLQGTDATHAPLAIRGGKVRITGIERPHQFAVIDAQSSGGLADAFALLRQPRLHLLDKHPVPGRDPSGQASVRMRVQLPLEETVKIDDVVIHAQGRLTDAHLTDLVVGRDLDAGKLDFDATNDGLKIGGDALLAGIATQLAVEMDFRAGPPSQIVQKVTASGRATARQMAAAGVDPGPLLSGAGDLKAVLTERRDGKGVVQTDADLTEAELSAAPIGWRKPAGSPAHLSAKISLDHDRLTAIDKLSLEGKDVTVQGGAEAVAGRVALLRFDRLKMGRTQAQGTVRFPNPDGQQPIAATFSGPAIDLSAISTHRRPPSTTATDPTSPAAALHPWSLDARFERAFMAGGHDWQGLVASALNDGKLFARLSLNGQTSPGQPFRFDLTPGTSRRELTATASDTGALFAGLDLTSTMRGGRLTLTGGYDDTRTDHPLSGTAEITGFRVHDPHGLGRLLQAMSLYGLVQAASGPGLGFTRLIAPFTLTDTALELGQLRAFNPSLGVTAKGRVDLSSNVADIEGTIVPAYFFNSLLGDVPLVGRLFSPEKGGGVFAASYTVRGPLNDPKVSVNPLSALTPGFLRGLFGLF